jgi:trehalose/maltose hydrolase-like predicted phosphorylase
MFELTTLFQKVSKFQMDFSLILNNNFIEPLTQFHGDSSRHNLKLFKELEALVTNLEKNKKAVKHSREAYYQLSSNAEKSEERLKAIIDKLDKGTVSKKELTRETEKSAELKVIAQEAKMAYEEKCQVSNRGWQEFREKFFVHFETFDLKEENRIDIVKRKVLALGNDLRSFHKTENPIPVWLLSDS